MEARTCKNCHETKLIIEFARDASCKGGYRYKCKSCHARKNQEYRDRNPEKHKAYVAKYNSEYRRGLKQPRKFNPDGSYDFKKQHIDNIKRSLGCIQCGEKEPVCLDFHHINPETKSFRVGDFVNRTLNEIDNEISKCLVLCTNCHRKLHAGIIIL